MHELQQGGTVRVEGAILVAEELVAVLVGAEVDVAAVGLDVIVDEREAADGAEADILLKEWRPLKRLIEREAHAVEDGKE